jgi:hypothetical protein
LFSGNQRPSPASKNQETADGCRMNLVAARLRLIQTQTMSDTEAGNNKRFG